MNVLFSLRPFRGHLHPFMPLRARLRAARHRVAAATTAEVAGICAGHGLTWFSAGIHPLQARERFPRESSDYGYSTLRVKVDDLIRIMEGQFQADVIVRDPTDLAAAIAAELCGVPCVTLGIANFIPVSSWQYLADESLARLRDAYGLGRDPDMGFLHSSLYADLVPPALESFDRPPTDNLEFYAYEPWDEGDPGAPPEWLAAMADRPTVLVTLGTVFNHRPDLIATFLRALADEDLGVICTLGEDQDAEALRVHPANVRFERYLPHSVVLPACDAVLCHAGFNTTMGAICAGVPLVAVPLGADQHYNARRCGELGVGICVDESGATPEVIRDAVRRVVTEPGFRRATAALRSEIHGLPDCSKLVDRIEQLAL
jgi:UDP:flavonoid glycosyltransferase YjiC (YdhE family)